MLVSRRRTKHGTRSRARLAGVMSLARASAIQVITGLKFSKILFYACLFMIRRLVMERVSI